MEKRFDLKVGFTCNNNCVHCVIADKREIFKETDNTEDLTTQQIKDIILKYESPKDTTFTITGGEATIREDFEEIINFIFDRGSLIQLQTNGTGLADEKLVKRIHNKLDHVLIAIHSFDEVIHNKIVGDDSGTHFKETMKGFNNLIKYKVNCSTQTVISKYNIDNLYDTYSKIQELVPGINMHMTYAHGMGNAWKNKNEVLLKYSEIKNQIHNCLRKFGRFIHTEAIPKCYLYPYENDIAYNYDNNCFVPGVSSGFDPSHKLSSGQGLVDENGVMQDYGLSNLSSKRKAKKCLECIFFNGCPGVWKEYIELYKKELDLFPIKLLNSGAILLRNENERCINECLFCKGDQMKNSPESSIDHFKESADYFIKNNFSNIEISGEPCQHPDLIEAVEYLRDNRINNIQISTHGRTFKDENLVKRLADAGVTHVRIPLYGSTKEIHQETAMSMNHGNSFDEAIKAIENCAKEGIKICGHTLINNYNKHDINNIYDLYKKLAGNLELIKEIVVGPTGISQLSYDWTGSWYLPIKDQKETLKSFTSHTENDRKENVFNVLILDIPYCAIEKYDEIISNTAPPPNLGNENVFPKESSSSTNTKVPHYREKTHFSECEKCSLKNICNGIFINELKLFGYYGLKAIKDCKNV